MPNPFQDIHDNDDGQRLRAQLLSIYQSELHSKYTPFVMEVLANLRDIAYQGHQIVEYPPDSWCVMERLPEVYVELIVDPDNLSHQFECKAFAYEAKDHSNAAFCAPDKDELIRTLKELHYHKR